MLTFFNRNLILPLLAAKRRSKHFHYLHQLEQSQYDAPEVVQARQLRMLQAQLHHAYATVPYYRRTWTAAGVHPADVKTLDDLKHFPIVTKQDIRHVQSELLSSAYDARNCARRKRLARRAFPSSFASMKSARNGKPLARFVPMNGAGGSSASAWRKSGGTRSIDTSVCGVAS